MSTDEQPCPDFPDRCPNLRTVEPDPPQHYGGVRCGCADAPSLQGVTITAAKVQASVISIPASNGRPVVTIHPDGRLEFGENYQPDEAALAFWEAVQRFTPPAMVREFGAPLTARINAELAAGQRAQKQLERIDRMAAHWLERLPDTILTATAVEAIHQVTRPEAT